MSPTRLVGLRMAAMAALPASTILTYDRMHPDRAICPLAEACERARESFFGSVAGVPTSTIGLLAFAGLFLLTLLPERWGRPILRPAALFAGLAGIVLIAFQALFLPAFCPVCLVADTAGIVAGVLAWSWPVPPRGVGRFSFDTESDAARIAWTLASILAVIIPFAWPRETKPGWVEIAPQTALLDGIAPSAPVASLANTPPRPTEAEVAAAPPPPIPTPPPRPEPTAILATQSPALPTPPAAPPPDRVAKPAPVVAAAPSPAPSARPVIGIVEYLNAYCAHCRATHRRLEKVLSEVEVSPRRRRIYTWSSTEAPLWARACAFAATRGLEDRLFEELLSTSSGNAPEVYAAAQRAGLDPAELRQSLDSPSVQTRLATDRRLSQGADLQGLPTLDIGRRRLLGEQSESELRDAVLVAIASPAR